MIDRAGIFGTRLWSPVHRERVGRNSPSRPPRWRMILLASALFAAAPSRALADAAGAPAPGNPSVRSGATDEPVGVGAPESQPNESAPPVNESADLEKGVPRAARRGGFLPLTVVPATDFTAAAAFAGYDGARAAAIYQAVADANVIGGLAVRAGYASHDLSGRASALLGARFQFLRQAAHSLDVGVGLFYLPQDMRGEGQIMGSLSLGRRFGSAALFAHVAYGQDPEGDDHTAQAGLAALYTVLPAFAVGIDGRLRTLVFSSDEKRTGLVEPKLDVTVGPVAHYLLGVFALTGQVGMSGIAMEGPVGSSREATDLRLGAVAMLGVGLAL